MKFTLISSCIAIAALAVAVDAAPGEKKISIPLAKNPNYKPSAKNAIQKAIAKYNKHKINTSTGGIVPDAGVGTVPMTDYGNDVEYYGQVTIGTPGKKFNLDFDTGSSDLWIASTLCTNCGSRQTKYDPKQSSTYQADGRTWSISYGDGSSASGILAKDNVNLGGLLIKGQTIELAKREAASFANGPNDGLLGLGFDTITTVRGVKTPMDNLISQGLISRPIFGVYLGKASNGGGGEYIFGGYDSTKFKGSLTTVPIDNSRGWWGITVDRATVGTSTVASSFDGILDTGTTLLILPNNVAASVARAYGASDNGDGTYTISCDTSRFKPLVFSINGASFQVSPDSLVFEEYQGQCIAGFGYGNFDFAIIGDTFLKNNYVVFNQGVPEVQIAPVAQ
ncbi:Putative Rhizopuspepsin-2 [Rhizopus microsporus]|uniref:Rhizopuspepsin n=1 Tax=Rhizopus chinensis TaxID=4843 RepID=CARP_RHICH|nr:RecName: Full=Rhizopuspepsin; Flags: Precursor [Rhizopus microsporus var. chinensis]AAB59305.1 rhizopuspepsin II [Rhizopus microsporus var. chinensis]AAB59306.1 rhizopuspepsin II [Rhizopus microsporus var. chinensis]CEG63565.1 Putative Rhizopuspepsin-2 [Rhizopus microsporus]